MSNNYSYNSKPITNMNEKSILANRNLHVRDANIKFYQRGHRYEITTDLLKTTALALGIVH